MLERTEAKGPAPPHATLPWPLQVEKSAFGTALPPAYKLLGSETPRWLL